MPNFVTGENYLSSFFINISEWANSHIRNLEVIVYFHMCGYIKHPRTQLNLNTSHPLKHYQSIHYLETNELSKRSVLYDWRCASVCSIMQCCFTTRMFSILNYELIVCSSFVVSLGLCLLVVQLTLCWHLPVCFLLVPYDFYSDLTHTPKWCTPLVSMDNKFDVRVMLPELVDKILLSRNVFDFTALIRTCKYS